MHLFPALEKQYTRDRMSAPDAQRLAEFIAWGPVIFQVSRLMLKFGILDLLRDHDGGMTRAELAEATKLSDYALKILLEGSLSIGTIKVDVKTDRYTLSKVGWFFLTDMATRANTDFNHDVNYEGLFHLDEALTQGYPAGLKHFGDWPTVYEGLSSLPEQVQKSWFGFDHFYSDSAFPDALKLIFGDKEGKKGQVCQQPVKSLLDVGGNTGKWAMKCVGYDLEVKVTIVDLPQQLEMMRRNVAGKEGAERISGIGMNLLDPNEAFQGGQHYDVIWMSQFLDCFSMEQIVSILKRVAQVMDKDSRVCIMETLWDRQKYETAAMCLTMTSVYFADIANGNSKMYNTEDMTACVEAAGLKVETIHDEVGQQGHCILVCKLSE